MAVETPREPAAALAGLDQLELAPPQQAKRHVLAKIWVAAWPKLLALVLALAIWQLVYLSGFKSGILPGPAATLPDLWHQLHTAQFWSALGTTLRRAVIGFALALVIGTVVGALVSRIRPLRAAVGSLITALQTLPSIVWVPFAIILFGATTQAILFVIIMTAAPAIANGLISGADFLPPLLLRAGKTMGLRRLSLYRHVIMPATLPAYVSGLKQGWVFGWHGLIAAEIVVIILGQPSLGVLLSNDQDQADMASAISIIIVILVIGIAVDLLFNVVNGRIRRRWGVADNSTSA
jgi:NitT/TauT family transport system permease protein